MSLRYRWRVTATVALVLLAPALRAEQNAAERQSLDELRNTVVNLLQAMVDKGMLTHEQAAQLVKQAQEKAAADAAALAAQRAQQAREEESAVRVPYVPQIVKDEISKQVAEQVKPGVVAEVVREAKAEKWGVPGALPAWLSRVRVFGDVTVREQSDWYARENDRVLDFQAINTAGGFGRAVYPFLDTTQDRNRLRLRARLGVEADLSPNIMAYVRLTSGSLTDPGSESQTFGTYGQRYSVAFDQAYIAWTSAPRSRLSVSTLDAGRMPNPWFAPTELIYARDLTFEGITETLRAGWGEGGADRSHVYLTLGGFPMLEVPLMNQENKWLVGGQLGTHVRFGDGSDHFGIAAAYYDFLHATGRKNAPDSLLLNFTAPAFVRAGNSMFDISNSTTDPTVNLFALAAHFRLANLAATYSHSFARYSLAIAAEGVRNVAYKRETVEALTGLPVPSNEDSGYVGEVSFGTPVVDRLGAWRAALGYRYVKADAVIDAWTDADFHEGGTNTTGYYLWTSFGLAPNTWLRLRYLSGNEIDGPRYRVDILQVDLNTRF